MIDIIFLLISLFALLFWLFQIIDVLFRQTLFISKVTLTSWSGFWLYLLEIL